MRLKGGSTSSSTPKKLRTEIAASLKLEAEGGRGGGGGGGGGDADDIAVIDDEGGDGDEQYGGGSGGSYQVIVKSYILVAGILLIRTLWDVMGYE